MQQDSNSFA